MTPLRIHATTLAVKGAGVLLMGPSGSGKSDLALRLIDRGATLVSDDYTELTISDGVVLAASPATIRGKIEVRGVGIVSTPHIDGIPVVLAIRLGGPVDRMPPLDATTQIAGIALPILALDAFEASTPIKVELALRHAREAP